MKIVGTRLEIYWEQLDCSEGEGFSFTILPPVNLSQKFLSPPTSPLIPHHLTLCRKLRDEYDKLEGALKKLGVDPECVVTEEDEEEDGYNAESDLEEDLERDTEREVATFVPSVYSLPCAQTSSRQPNASRLLDRVDEVLTLY